MGSRQELTPDLGDGQKRILNGLALSVQSPPKLEIVSPEPGSFVNTAMPVIELRYRSHGEIDTGSIRIMWGSLRVPLDCTADQTEAHCTAILPPMVQGEITLTATVADTRGRVSEPAQVTFTIDTLPPAISVTNPPEGLITNQAQLTVSGNVSESPQTLTLDHDGELVSLQTDSSNAFSHAITLNEGGNSLTITALDAAGNIGSAVLNATLDTMVPATPDIGLITIGSPIFGVVSVNGQSGSVEPGSQIVITNLTTGESVTATAGSNGAFSADITAQAGDAIQITTADAAGNSSESVQGEVQEGDESDATKGELTLLANPPLVFIKEVRDVRFSVNVLKGTDDIVEDVHLVQTDAEGNVLADIGKMVDNGENGDRRAGNWTYTITLAFNELAPVTRYYRAIVNLQNDDRQILSQVQEFRITEAPYSKEPDEDKLVYDLGYPFPVNQIIVRLPENETKNAAQALADMVGGTIVGYTPTVNLYLLEVPATTVEQLDAFSEQLKNDPRVAGVMWNFLIDFEVVNDMTNLRAADADKARPFENIRAFQAWDMIYANLGSLKLSPVHVGIMDTGVNINHPEFAGVKFGYLGIKHDPGAHYRGTCGDVDSHGTGVAGIIGASSTLSAPGVEMNGVLGGVVDDSGKPAIPYTLSIAGFQSPHKFNEEIDRMIAAGSRVINFSAGMTLKDALSGSDKRCFGADKDKFDEYVNTWKIMIKKYEKNVVFVASAGNYGIDVTANHAPAGSIHADNFIAVAATSAQDQKSDFSNHGTSIDIAAPGGGSSSSDRVYVPTQYSEPLSSNDYDGKRGTSFSAPFVTGAVALIKSLDKDNKLTPKQIKQLIRDTADPIETTPSIGGKRLNVYDLTRCGIDENFVWHYAGVGFGNDGPELGGSFATVSKFRVPFGADHGPDGSLYVVDRVRAGENYGSRVKRIDPNGMVEVIAGVWVDGGFSGDGGPAINARFNGLTDVAVGKDGSIYLADQFNSRVRWIDPQGIIHTLAVGVGGDSNAGRYITGVAVADDGTVYFTQQDPNAVFRVKNGVTRIAGADDAGVGIAYGLNVGPDGSVYLADSYNGRILKISPKGEFSTIAGSGQLSVPYDVDIDYKGNLYVADDWDYNVKKITPNGEVSVIIPEFEDPIGISVSEKDCGVVVVSGFGEIMYRYD